MPPVYHDPASNALPYSQNLSPYLFRVAAECIGRQHCATVLCLEVEDGRCEWDSALYLANRFPDNAVDVEVSYKHLSYLIQNGSLVSRRFYVLDVIWRGILLLGESSGRYCAHCVLG